MGQEYGFGIVGYAGRIFGLAIVMPCPRLRPNVGGLLRCECWCWMFAMGFARLVALLGPWSCLGLSWGGWRVNLGRGCLVAAFVSLQRPTFDVPCPSLPPPPPQRLPSEFKPVRGPC